MELGTFILVLVTSLFLCFLRKFRRDENSRRKGLKDPPGPRGLPVVGNVFQLTKHFNEQFTVWSKQFGDIYQVWLGNQQLIVISNPKWTKELFSVDPAFSGRPYFEGFDIYEQHPKFGIIHAEGLFWEQHRRFLLRQLRDFGFGKSAMESRILEELGEVLSRFKATSGQPVGDIRNTLRLATVNSLWSILTSERFDHDDPKLTRLALNTTEVFNEVSESGAILAFMPWLRHIAPRLSGYTKVRQMFAENEAFFWNTIQSHKKNLKEDDLKDFVDVYLNEVKNTQDTSSVFYGEVAERQLAAILFDMFIAGGDTIASTLAWAVLYLCMYPEVQTKFQKEVEEITGGNGRKVGLSDRAAMMYTQAVIEEVLRFSSIASDGVQHCALADKEFHGYFIPKGAMIQANFYFMHHDPKIWGDPEVFRPERFLEEVTGEGGGRRWKYNRNENMQAFSVGRRVCVGESLARDSVFLYLTHLFQQFSMEFDPSRGRPGVGSEPGFVRAPLPYWVVMKNRL